MRRLFALVLIATSAWLLYQTAIDNFGGLSLTQAQWARVTGEQKILFPFFGAVLGLLGGLTVFFNGPGGATIAMGGGLAVSAFAVALKPTFDLNDFWHNEMAVGVVMLMLAAMTASISRITAGTRRMSQRDDDHRTYSSGRRTF